MNLLWRFVTLPHLFPHSTASHSQPGMLWASPTLLSCRPLAATSHISGEPGEKSPAQGLWWPRGTGSGKGKTCKKQFHMARFAKCWSSSWIFWPNRKSGSRSVALLFLRWKNLGAMRHFCLSFYARNSMCFSRSSCISKEQTVRDPKNL